MPRQLTPPFVGRDAELAALAGQLDDARHGSSRMVVIDGEPGIGKSTLVRNFVGRLSDGFVLRASGDDAESLRAFGLVRQLVAAAAHTLPARGRGERREIADDAEPLDVADALVALVRGAQHVRPVTVILIDDLPSADRASAVAILAAVRRLHEERVLALFTARSADLVRLGEGWSRFLAGDHRTTRMRLTGLTRPELVALGEALGAGRLSTRGVRTLLEYTGGNPLHCCALLEELDSGAWRRADRLPAPRALSSVVLARLGSLGADTQRLVSAAAVLGRRCQLDAAARLAELTDPVDGLQEACEGGILVETRDGPATEIEFSHALIHSAVYDDLGSARRRRMHRAAVTIVGWDAGLAHRVAAATGPDGALADDLEVTAGRALRQRQSAQAASWLAQAAIASDRPSERDRRALDALEVLIDDGAVADAEAMLAADEHPASPRRKALGGELALLAGRSVDARASLLEAWNDHDPQTDAQVGARAAVMLAWSDVFDGRLVDARRWGELAEASCGSGRALRGKQLALKAMIAAIGGRENAVTLELSPTEASDGSPGDTELLFARGLAMIAGDDLAGVIADLSTVASRLQAGAPARLISQCLAWLGNAEYRRGEWDAASAHGELAVALAAEQDRVWDLALAHAHATRVPAARGEWATASEHVEAGNEAAQQLGSATALAASATARATLASAQGDHDGALRAADEVRGQSGAGRLERSGIFDWRAIEVDTLISVGQLQRAEHALDELATGTAATDGLSGSRLAGRLANARGDTDAAERCFKEAWKVAAHATTPFQLAHLEIDDARRLRQVGRRSDSIQRLRSARVRLERLGATPYVAVCDLELTACGVTRRRDDQLGMLGLTHAESAVARLVASGHTNREVASDLYLSVKTVEFHLRNIFSKLNIHGRRELAARIDVESTTGA